MRRKNLFLFFHTENIKVLIQMIIHPLVNLVTALVPSEMACLASSPGKRSLTAV